MQGRVRRFAVLVLLSLSAGAWSADGGARAEYLRALKRLEDGKGGSLEEVFASGRAASKEVRSSSEALAGFRAIDEGALFVVPDTRYFLDLAKRQGTEKDQGFFTLLNRTYYGTPWRVYVRPLTPVSGCIRFDSPELGPLYREWTRFWAEHARDYTAEVEREVHALEDAFARNTCACGDRASVEQGLQGFLQSFPRSPVAPQVRDRLTQVREGTSDFRFECHAD